MTGYSVIERGPSDQSVGFFLKISMNSKFGKKYLEGRGSRTQAASH
jgi:hypothetical protein